MKGRGLEGGVWLADQAYFPRLVAAMSAGPVVGSVWEGLGAVAAARALVGATYPLQRHAHSSFPPVLLAERSGCSEPGTIRGDWALHQRRNLVHASDSPEAAEREIPIWSRLLGLLSRTSEATFVRFPNEELVKWQQSSLDWVIER